MMYLSNISDRLSSLIRFKIHFSRNALLLDEYFQSPTLDCFSLMIQSFVTRILAVTFSIMIKLLSSTAITHLEMFSLKKVMFSCCYFFRCSYSPG